MKVYVTKYALTAGVQERELLRAEGEMATVEWPGGINRAAYFHGDQWHETREDAVAQAESMRSAKIASLRKQIAKLEKLRFAP